MIRGVLIRETTESTKYYKMKTSFVYNYNNICNIDIPCINESYKKVCLWRSVCPWFCSGIPILTNGYKIWNNIWNTLVKVYPN